eukprot:TRINITY_DN9161_c0_g2_i4.p1 TRINITY_DN9161_c0_g2~~TRINITY_DN9161_c0_g2_i4.p1  ORF type:complete len:131 (-),score=20.32 TRINITY_DN9161_c0_g2_i4:120-512(-)
MSTPALTKSGTRYSGSTIIVSSNLLDGFVLSIRGREKWRSKPMTKTKPTLTNNRKIRVERKERFRRNLISPSQALHHLSPLQALKASDFGKYLRNPQRDLLLLSLDLNHKIVFLEGFRVAVDCCRRKRFG